MLALVGVDAADFSNLLGSDRCHDALLIVWEEELDLVLLIDVEVLIQYLSLLILLVFLFNSRKLRNYAVLVRNSLKLVDMGGVKELNLF